MSRKTVDTGLLKNILRHTDAHNKIQEQNEMWKQWELKKQSRKRTYSPETNKRQIRGYMRSDAESDSGTNKESLKWNRLLMEYEESCKDRWGHSGYKELYPEEFGNGDSDVNDSESDVSSSEKQKRNEGSGTKKEKNKKREKERMKATGSSSNDEADEGYKQETRTRISKHKHSRTNKKEKNEKRKRRTKH